MEILFPLRGVVPLQTSGFLPRIRMSFLFFPTDQKKERQLKRKGRTYERAAKNSSSAPGLRFYKSV